MFTDKKINEELTQPVKTDLLPKGFKGKGMCAECAYSDLKIQYVGYAKMMCGYYGNWCQAVSRNCLGKK